EHERRIPRGVERVAEQQQRDLAHRPWQRRVVDREDHDEERAEQVRVELHERAPSFYGTADLAGTVRDPRALGLLRAVRICLALDLARLDFRSAWSRDAVVLHALALAAALVLTAFLAELRQAGRRFGR